MSKRFCFRTPFGSQRVNGPQTWRKSARQHFDLIVLFFNSIVELIWKTSLLVRLEILWLLGNTLTADDKFSRNVRENFPELIPMHLSERQNVFVKFSFRFLNLHKL